ncbi:hypothetical protein JCM9279_007218 [Rhodotorula babjevae]
MAEYEVGSRRHETLVIDVAQAYSSALELFCTIIEAVPDAVLGSTRPRSSAYTPEHRRAPANVMQPRASSTWPGAAPSSSAEPQEPKSMSAFDAWSSDDEPPAPPARKHAMRNILRRGHKRSGSSRSQQ